jgi:hypothetical protein
MGLQDYSWMLNDPGRIGVFRRAIAAEVGPGDVVVEIGAGLGTYSFMACQAGAGRVYAIEDSAFVALESIAKRQDFGDRLKLISGNSLEAKLPEKADLIIYEDFNSAFLGAGLAEIVRDTSDRLLKPGGRWLPCEAVVCGALIEAADQWNDLVLWRNAQKHLEGLNFKPLSDWLLNSEVRGTYDLKSLITAPCDLKSYSFGNREESFDLAWRGRDTVVRAGKIHGICVWFRLEFAGGEVLDNAPGANKTVYQQEFFPLSAPLSVEEDQEVEWTLHCVRGAGEYELWWKWGAEAGGKSAEGTTFASFPSSIEDLKKRSEDHVPHLSARHHVLKFVMDAADGTHNQGEIASEVFAAFPEQFTSEKDAFRYVAKVLGE